MRQEVTEPASHFEASEDALHQEVAVALHLDLAALTEDDDLFEVGLDSLTVIRLAAGWRRRGFPVTFEELAEAPTLRQWRALLTRNGDSTPGGAGAADPPRSAAGNGTEPFALAPMQHAYWVGRQDGQPGGGVGSHFFVEFDGAGLCPDRLQAALDRLVDRHEMLRVRFTDDGRQWVSATAALPAIAVHDLRELSPDQCTERLGELREQYTHRRFDIDRGEVFEIALSLLPGGVTRLHVDLDMMVADALSMTVLLADLAAFYSDPDAGRPELDYSFRRFLADRADPQATRRRRDAAWWSERIPELPGGPALPIRSGTGTAAARMLRLHHHLDASATAALAGGCRRHSLTAAAALTTVFAEVMAAWSGTTRFVLNLPLFDREPLHPSVDHLVGDFTGSVLLEVDLAEPRPFAEQGREVQSRLHAAVGHGAFSGIDVLRELSRRAGDPVLAPVVHTSAVGLGEMYDRGVREHFGDPVWVSSQNPQVWLDAQVRELDGGLLLNWDTRTDMLCPGVPQEMFAAYRDLVLRLAGGEAAWRRPVGSLLPAGAALVRRQVNDTARALPRRTLHEAFFAVAAADPDRVAVVGTDETPRHPGRREDPEGELTYGGLALRARRVGALLVTRGVWPGDPVAITLPKGPDQVVAVLGVLAAGGCYVPVGVDQPPARRERILARAAGPGRSVVVLTDDEHAARAGGTRGRAVTLSAAEAFEPLPAPVPVDPDAAAYLLFTSGSTGEPKGVEVSHAAAVNTVEALNALFTVARDDRTLLVSALDFDLSVYDMFGPLSAGGALVALREDERRDAHRWWTLVEAHRVTVWNTVPVLLDMLLTAAPTDQKVPLRVVLLGGDWVGPDLPARVHAVAPGCRFAALGGMTEAAIHSTVLEVQESESGWRSVPWGVPLPNVQCRVVDPRGRDCPDWVSGELWVGGAGVALGYRGDPERTAERFVRHDGTRWYRSGDLARYRPGGTLEFLGRSDHQVKIRGHRIELGEIEAALEAHPAVRRAVAAVLEAPSRGLAAAVSTREQVSAAELREWQAGLLAAPMVCDRISVLDALPLTANGKPDRAAVTTRLAAQHGSVELVAEPPAGPVEQRLAAIWSELLDAPVLGRADSFFALGGDSLLATQLLGRLRVAGLSGARLGVLFGAPRLAEFAATLTFGGSESTGPVTVTADQARRHEPFPATDVQAAYWLGRDPRFTLGGVGTWQYAEFDGTEVDLDRLERAWQRLVDRHEMLRAVFDAEGRQRILAGVPQYRIAVRDLTGADPDVVAAGLERLRAEGSHRLLELTQWPLFELAAVRYRDLAGTGTVRTRLAIGLDYIIFDALSIMILFTELDRLYADPDAELAPIELSFRDYLLQVRPDPDAARRAEDHWRTRLDELPDPPQLPLRTDPATAPAPRFTRRHRRLTPGQWSAITRRARQHGLTPSTVLLAAYAEVLGAWSAAPELTVTLTLFNRREVHPHVNRVLGDFTSLSLAGYRPVTGQGWLEAARDLQRRLGADLDHRDVSPSWLLRELARRTGTLDAAVPVVFTSAIGVGQQESPVSMDMSGTFPPRVWGVSQSPQVCLDNQVMEAAGGLLVNWDAVEELFCDGVLDAMFDAYGRLLGHLAGEDRAGQDWTGALPELLPPTQRDVRRAVNDTAAPLPAGLLHVPFFDAAPHRAANPALIWAGGTLSHGELAQRALRLAAGLLARGVRPGDPVAITLPKGPDQVVAVLGVLAAGGAYVPVGAEQPPRRRAQVHRTAGARLVITEVDALLAGEALPEPVGLDPESLGYVIFTSGSTGTPKGVEITHAAAANTVADASSRFAVGPADRVLALSALDFDLSVYDIFGLLGAGGALVLPAEHERRDAHRWRELATAHGVTLWNTVPVLLEMLLVASGPDAGSPGLPPGLPPALRLALVSGDWVPLELPERLRVASGGRCRLVALGGATEASIWSNALEVTRVPAHWPSVPYGFPLANQRYRVADGRGVDRPDWAPGELWIGGAGVARGYRGDPARTAERFVHHEGERWYRTGDLGRYWPDGTLEFLGRADQQVKVGGHRLELGEVEAAFAEHPDVARVVVVAVGPRDRRVLHAFLASTGGAPPDLDVFLAQRLAPHAIPARRTVLDTLPLTANGKVDRAAVHTMAEQDQVAAARRPPDGPLETALARLWAELLEIPPAALPARDANFFALGGTSLTALRLVTAVDRQFGVEVPIRRLFAAPTVAGLAAELAHHTERDEEIGAV